MTGPVPSRGSRFPLPRFIAWRYLVSRRMPAAVQVLSWISMTGIGLATAALVLVLSVFNGFQTLLQNLFSDVDPPLRIVPREGRYLPRPDSLLAWVQAQPEVALALPSLEGRAIVSYAGHQSIVRLKGVPEAYRELSRLPALVQFGEFRLQDPDSFYTLVMGAGVATRAGVNLMDDLEPLRLFTVTGDGNLMTAPEQAIREARAFPAGVFSIHKEYDDQLVFAHLNLARQLFAQPSGATSLDLRLHEGADLERTRRRLQQALGPHLEVQSWYGQHETLFRVLRNEKAVGYLVLSLMLLLAASTIVGTLSMVTLDKQADLAVLRAAGASRTMVQRVFLWQGLYIGTLAGLGGLLLGGVLGWVQQTFGLLSMAGGESFLVEAFPLQMQVSDFVLIFTTVAVLAVLSSALPAWRASQGTIAQRFRA